MSVEKLFPNSTIVCMATGASLTPADVDYCRGKAPVVAVNDAYRLAPWADVLYACDAKWWSVHQGVPDFAGLKFSVDARASKWAGVQVLANTGARGIETAPTGLKTGKNSAYQAMNLALHLGAVRILMLGLDLCVWPGQRSHFFGEHPREIRQDGDRYTLFRNHFAHAVAPLKALGVSVINCSARTALTCFPCRPLREVLS